MNIFSCNVAVTELKLMCIFSLLNVWKEAINFAVHNKKNFVNSNEKE